MWFKGRPLLSELDDHDLCYAYVPASEEQVQLVTAKAARTMKGIRGWLKIEKPDAPGWLFSRLSPE